MFLTFKYRVKDATVGKRLDRMARAVNFVWNYCGDIQEEARRWSRRWPSAFDLHKLTAGSGRELGLHSDIVNAVCTQFAESRNQHGKRPRWRGKKSLGWIPFNHGWAFHVKGDTVTVLKQQFRLWLHRPIEGKIKTGSFAKDAKGRWYLNVVCEIAEDRATGTGEIGIDLGLKALATCSDGVVIPALQHYRRYETDLGKARRARNTRRVKAIHAKIANARKHHLHEHSARIARENSLIVVGDVNAAQLAKTRMAKSVFDAGWSTFRNQLRYKAIRHGARYVEADERWTTQACSDCGSIGGPKGREDLGIRHWECSSCGAAHDRDVNAAKNILRVGRECPPPAVGIAA